VEIYNLTKINQLNFYDLTHQFKRGNELECRPTSQYSQVCFVSYEYLYKIYNYLVFKNVKELKVVEKWALS
jgi:hypothetical protein